MKKLLLVVIIIVLFLPGRSSEPPSLELVSFNVELTDSLESNSDYGIATSEYVTHTLEYQFVLKNTGKKTVGGKTENNRLDTKIIPNEKLKQVSEEVMLKNIYDGIYLQNGVFVGTPISGRLVYNLLSNAEGQYSIGYYLGPYEEYEFRKVPPSQEELEELKKNAMDATLVILVKGKEVARFDLRNETNIK